MTEDAATIPASHTTRGRAGGRLAAAGGFGRHFLEMVLAMMAGMMVLGMVIGGLLAAFGLDYGAERDRFPALFALVMAANMTVGMAAWMRFRGHRWQGIAEMGGAMFLPVLALLPPFWLGVIGAGALVGLEHALMLPAMLAVMLARRDEYLHRHGPARGPAHGQDAAPRRALG